jgi:hypothetical protein
MKFITKRTKNLQWDKKYILLATVLASAINFIIGVFGIKFFGQEIIGDFQQKKSIVQLIAALQPSITFSFIATLSGSTTIQNQELIDIKKSNLFSIFWIAILTVLFFFFIGNSKVLAYYFLLLSFYLSGVSGIYARGLLRSDLLIHGAIVEGVVSVLSTFFLFIGRFDLFIWSFGIRFFLKAIVTFPVKYWGFAVPDLSFLKRRNRIGSPFLIRGFIQTFIQYGDKALIGFAFSNSVVAYYSIGSAFAIPFIIISSSAATYYLSILERDGISENILKDSYKLLVLIALILPCLEVFISYAYKSYDKISIVSGYFNLSLVSLISLFSLIYGKGNIWKSNFLNFSVIIVQLIFVVCSKFYDTPMVYMFVFMIFPLLIISLLDRQWKSFLMFLFFTLYYLLWQIIELPITVLISLSLISLPIIFFLLYSLFIKKRTLS